MEEGAFSPEVEEIFGQPLWSDEEVDQSIADDERRRKEYEEKLAKGFWQDGNTRTVLIESVQKEDKIGKNSGRPYVLHTYNFIDAMSGEKEKLTDYDFAMTNALDPIKKSRQSIKLGITPIRVTTTKKGEDEFNGIKRPIWKHEAVLADKAEVDFDKGMVAKHDAEVAIDLP